MNYKHFDRSLPLHDRMLFSQNVANKINQEYANEDDNWKTLENDASQYFSELKTKKLDEEFIFKYNKNKGKLLWRNWIFLILTLPIFLIGAVNFAIPYYITKTSVEKMFKRKVFWSGVKLVLGGLVVILYNLPLFWLLPKYVYVEFNISSWIGFLFTFFYMLTVMPYFLVFWYNWKKTFVHTIKFANASREDIEQMNVKRNSILQQIKEVGI